MIGIAVITHGKFAEGIKDSLRMIVGEQENFESLGLKEGQGLEEFKGEVKKVITKVNDGSGVLIFVDMFGATPFNSVSMIRNELKNDGVDALMITGVNLPVLLEASTLRSGANLEGLANQLTNSCRESIELLDLR